MKPVLYLLFCLFIPGAPVGVVNHLTNEKFNGKVKSIAESIYTTNDKGQVMKYQSVQKHSYSFSPKGYGTGALGIIDQGADEDGLTTTYKYDTAGRAIWSEMRSNADKQREVMSIYRYNQDKQLIEKDDSIIPMSVRVITRYTYDASGNLDESTESQANAAPVVTKYKYDEKGHLIERTHFGKPVEKVTYTYSDYDQQANWKKRVDLVNGKPANICLRAIVYY